MTVSSPVYIGIFFLALSIIFLGAEFRDYFKNERKRTISQRIRLRTALIFSCVGIGLIFSQAFFREWWN